MNTKASVAYGWATFTVCTVAGGYVGYRQFKAGSVVRRRKQLEQNAKHERIVEEFNRKNRLEKGSKRKCANSAHKEDSNNKDSDT